MMSVAMDIQLAIQAMQGDLDGNPADWGLRLVLADAYEDAGDLKRAELQRWLVRYERHPVKYEWWSWYHEVAMTHSSPACIPHGLFKLTVRWSAISGQANCYGTREIAEEQLLAVNLSHWHARLTRNAMGHLIALNEPGESLWTTPSSF